MSGGGERSATNADRAIAGWRCAAILIALSVAVMIPAIAFGQLFREDAPIHYRWQLGFADLIWRGDLAPRWLPDMNQGFGSPAFFIYPPMTQWIASLFAPALPGAGQVGIRLALSSTLALALGGIGMWRWLERATGDRAAGLFGAALYVVLPYHLFVDTYHRGALAELWALGFVPWAFAAIQREHGDWRRVAALVIAVAGLFLSHAPSALVMVPLVALYAAAICWTRRSLADLVEYAACIVLGTAIAGFYLATALTQTRFIVAAALFAGQMAPTRWLIGVPRWPDPSFPPMVVALNLAHLAIAGAALWLARRYDRGSATRLAALRAIICIVALTFVLQTALARPFWVPGNPLSRIQFPWRLIGVQILLLAAAGSLAMHVVRRLPRWRVLLLAALPLCVLLNAALLLYEIRREHGRGDVAPTGAAMASDTTDAPEYRLVPTAPLTARFGPMFVLVADGRAVATPRTRAARSATIDVVAATPAVLLIHQYAYSGWRYRIDDGGWRPAAVRDGLPAFAVPAGRHRIVAELVATGWERAGRLISLAALVVFAVWLVYAFVRPARDASRPSRLADQNASSA